MTANKGITIDKTAITDIIKEISTYDNPQFNFCVAIYEDGSAERGDLHINDQSWTRWRGNPIIKLTVKPWYTTAGIEADGNNAEDRGTVESYSETAAYGIESYVEEVSDIVSEADGDWEKAQHHIDYEMDNPYGNMPW